MYDTVFNEDIAIAGYKWLDYDLAVLGNHEFNNGPDPIFNTVMNTPSTLQWIVSNVNFSTAPQAVRERLNIAIDAYEICWVSVLTESTNDVSSPGPDTRVTDELTGMNKAIASCKQQKRVIAVNHQGYEQDLKMCNDVKEIDLIIGAHTHTNLDNGRYPTKVEREDGSVCWVTQAYAFGRYIGMLDIEFDDEGALELPSYAYTIMDFRVRNDPEVASQLAVFTDKLNEKVLEVVAQATEDIDGSFGCRSAECQMGNLACDAFLDYSSDRQGAVACFLNAGGIRDSIAKGDITIKEILNVFPFGNVHVVITLPGSGILAVLEHGFTAVDSENNNGRFPQVGGMIVTADLKAPAGSRVKSVVIDGEPLVETTVYKIVTNSFIASGGDGFTWPGATEFEFSGRALSELSQDYLVANSPYTPVIEGRVVV